ncbi:MAG TPA: MASE3 domain-containing protein, partial [Gammaproteobacteria bacterium]|nr:MASE3 domain-containing protein [Gammaproteobacteria bacterium]
MGKAVFADTSGNTLRGNLIAFFGVLAALLVAVAFSYPLFHSLVELATVVIAIAAGVVGWHTFPFSRNHFLLYLAAGYFWVAVVDLFHLLSYSGVEVIAGDGGNRATQFWIVGRYLEAALFLAAPFFLGRTPTRLGQFVAFGAIALFFCGLILFHQFPTAFVEGSGLTPFKVVSEYIIMALLAVALGHLWLRRHALDRQVWQLLAFAIVVTALSEFAFTLYTDTFGLENLLGHLGKLVSYWAIFYAIVHLTLTEPFRWMARGAQSFDAVPDVTLILDREGIVRHSNPAALRFAHVEEDECLGRHCHELFHPEELEQRDCPVCQAIAEGVADDIRMELHFPERRQWRQISLAPVLTPTGAQGVVHIGRDITQRREAEEALAIRHDELDSILTSVGEGVLGMDTAGRATYVNNAFERLTGWTEEEFIGRNGHEMLHHSRPDGSPFPLEECPVHRTVAEGLVHHQAEDTFWRRDGSSLPVEYTSAAVRDRNGTITGA